MTENLKQADNTPKARGLRLKRLRNLANLSRQDFCAQYDLNINTYKGWEIGRHGGVTVEAAEKLVKIFDKHHIICSVEWLLEGYGGSPQVLPEPLCTTGTLSVRQQEHLQINKELQLFKQAYKDISSLQIQANNTYLDFQANDYVAGLKQTKGFKKLCQHIVIVETSTDDCQVGLLLAHQAKSYQLDTDQGLINVGIPLSVAKIIWHRKSAY